MRTSCAMTASRVTPPTEEKGAKVEGVEEVEEVGGVVVSVQGCLG